MLRALHMMAGGRKVGKLRPGGNYDPDHLSPMGGVYQRSLSSLCVCVCVCNMFDLAKAPLNQSELLPERLAGPYMYV